MQDDKTTREKWLNAYDDMMVRVKTAIEEAEGTPPPDGKTVAACVEIDGQEQCGERVADPDLLVRIYHDALMAEAMACTRHHRHAALKEFDTRPGAELSRRWTRNVMLNKWLEYCVDKGHRFFPSSEDIAIS